MKGKDVVRFFFPSVKCCLCQGRSCKEFPGICSHCLQGLLATRVNLSFCNKCLQFYSGRFSRCPACFNSSHKRYYHHGFSALPYEGNFSAPLVKQFKYKNQKYLGETMADLIASFDDIGEKGSYALLVAVPRYEDKEDPRLYNQAEVLAECLGERCDMEHLPKALIKTRKTAKQASLNGITRRKNVKDAFRVNPTEAEKIEGRNIVLVDDVVTTGATVNNCAKGLKQAGAGRIKVVTFSAKSTKAGE